MSPVRNSTVSEGQQSLNDLLGHVLEIRTSTTEIKSQVMILADKMQRVESDVRGGDGAQPLRERMLTLELEMKELKTAQNTEKAKRWQVYLAIGGAILSLGVWLVQTVFRNISINAPAVVVPADPKK